MILTKFCNCPSPYVRSTSLRNRARTVAYTVLWVRISIDLRVTQYGAVSDVKGYRSRKLQIDIGGSHQPKASQRVSILKYKYCEFYSLYRFAPFHFLCLSFFVKPRHPLQNMTTEHLLIVSCSPLSSSHKNASYLHFEAHQFQRKY